MEPNLNSDSGEFPRATAHGGRTALHDRQVPRMTDQVKWEVTRAAYASRPYTPTEIAAGQPEMDAARLRNWTEAERQQEGVKGCPAPEPRLDFAAIEKVLHNLQKHVEAVEALPGFEEQWEGEVQTIDRKSMRLEPGYYAAAAAIEHQVKLHRDVILSAARADLEATCYRLRQELKALVNG